MKQYQAENIDVIIAQIAKDLMKCPDETRIARGLKTRELHDVYITLLNPESCVCDINAREFSMEYLIKELNFYKSGSLDVEDIAKASKFWNSIADENGKIQSNYGYLAKIEKYNGLSQFEWCSKSLKQDKYTRQAVINFNQPKHKRWGIKDFVCTISMQFILRNDFLDAIVYMRSNDLIYGFCYDIVYFVSLLQDICKETGLEMGRYVHFATSMHVYEKHFDMCNKIIEEGISKKLISQLY